MKSLDSRKQLLYGLLIVGAGLAVPQILAYLASIFAARILNPADFGAFGTIQGITQIGQPIGLGIQALIVSKLIKNSKKSYKNILKFGLEISIFVFIANMVISIPLSNIFKVDYLVLVLAIGAVSPFIFVSTQLGVAQGKELYIKLALIYISFGVGRSVTAIVGLLIYPNLISVSIGFFVGTFLSAVISHFILGNGGKFWKIKKLRNETLSLIKSTQALLALYVLVNVDILIARIVLSQELSGVYAVGMLVAKIAFFMPQAITVVLFPKMGKNQSSSLKYAILGTISVGVAYIIICYFGSQIIIQAIGGKQYTNLYNEIWIFAVEGTLFAILQVLLYGKIAKDNISVSILLWMGTFVTILLAWILNINSISSIVNVLIFVTSTLIMLTTFSESVTKKRKMSFTK